MAQSSSQCWASLVSPRRAPDPVTRGQNKPTISTMSNSSGDLFVMRETETRIVTLKCEFDNAAFTDTLFYLNFHFILCFGNSKCKFLLVFLFSDEAIMKKFIFPICILKSGFVGLSKMAFSLLAS